MTLYGICSSCGKPLPPPTSAAHYCITDPMIGMQIAKCPHCGEELSIWPDAFGRPDWKARAEAAEAEVKRLRDALEDAARAIHGEWCVYNWDQPHDCAAATYRALIEETP